MTRKLILATAPYISAGSAFLGFASLFAALAYMVLIEVAPKPSLRVLTPMDLAYPVSVLLSAMVGFGLLGLLALALHSIARPRG